MAQQQEFYLLDHKHAALKGNIKKISYLNPCIFLFNPKLVSV